MTYFILFFHWYFSKSWLKSIWLEYRVPSKSILSFRLNNLTFTLPNENQWFLITLKTKCYCALSVGIFIIERLKHFIKTFTANVVNEWFDIRTGQSFQRIETEGDIFNYHCCVTVFCSITCFSFCDFFRGAL